MIRGLDAVMISTEDPIALADFYADKVGLELKDEYEMGEGGQSAYSFNLGNVELYINPHVEVRGKNPSPPRIMLNIEVDDCEKECKRLKDAGVKCIAEVYHIEGYGYVCTFEDLDGNYFQLVQVRES
jgi:predicted enzyme related to lactoylglutathione lyase